MRGWRTVGIAVALAAAAAVALSALLRFLAPGLSYEITDRLAEVMSGQRGRTYKIALGSRSGSYYRFGTLLNTYLEARAGYRLELVVTGGQPENVAALTDPASGVHLATIDSASDEAAKAPDLRALAAIGQPFFFVMVPNAAPARDFRELSGAVNPGVRAAGQSPTLGERVLAHYGLIPPDEAATGTGTWPVSIVRPSAGSLGDQMDAGTLAAATRTQFLYDDLVDTVMNTGAYRVLPIHDHDAVARAIPGTAPGFIPSGVFGPGRTLPTEPVPTLVVTSLVIARRDLPGRVARDILDAIYDPRFGRDLQRSLNEEEGRDVGHMTLHPAADFFYRRGDALTSERLGRLSFVASVVAGTFATIQFVLLYRRSERRKARRSLLVADLEKLRALRTAIDEAPGDAEARALIMQADDLLGAAEMDAAADRLDADGIATLRSVHAICWRAFEHYRGASHAPIAPRDA